MVFPDTKSRPNPCLSCEGICRGSDMAATRTEIAIERIIASCDGNVRGALEALLLVNEHLEAELHRLYAAIVLADQMDKRLDTVH